jgi:urease accessory protein
MLLRAVLTFDARCKSRLLLTLDNGERAALIVERGRILRDGERVKIGDGREVEIVSAEESLLEAVSSDPLVVARAAYHLGNRHVAVQLMPDRLRFLADHVLAEMVAGLGLKVDALVAPFEPEGGAYGHQHGQGHRHAQGHEDAPGDRHAQGQRHAEGSEMPAIRPKIHSFSSQ